MSILEGDVIDLHQYEHELIRASLLGESLPEPPRIGEGKFYMPFEWAVVDANRRAADGLYLRYRASRPT